MNDNKFIYLFNKDALLGCLMIDILHGAQPSISSCPYYSNLL